MQTRCSRSVLLIPMLVLLTQTLLAQEDWYVGKRIHDIEFVGLRNVTETDVSGITAPFIGRDFSDALFSDLQRRLYAVDYFELLVPEAVDVFGDRSEVTVRFTVTERPIVERISIEGLRNVRRNDVLDAILLTQGDVVTDARVRADAAAVADLYRERGFPYVQVRTETTERGDNRVEVLFIVTEGTETSVSEIRFSGNDAVAEGPLRRAIATKARSLVNRGAYQERTVEEDRAAIETYYRERGYIDAVVTDVATEIATSAEDTRDLVTITFIIEEGQAYTFGGYRFEGNTIFDDDRLSEVTRQRVGRTANLTLIQIDLLSVRDVYYENGYIFNTIGIDEDRSEDDRSVSYVITIVEQDRAYIERITISGNEKTEDHVILRELPFEEGDIFSASRIREGVQNLTNLQYFSSVVPETPEGSVPGLMELAVAVEETNTADIRFGVNFGGSTEFPVSATVKWQDINFLGKGLVFGVETNLSPVQQQLSFNFQDNWLFGRRLSAGVDLSADRSIRSDIPQDVLGPVFGDGDASAVPDPFTGDYVFSQDTEYPADSGVTFSAGTAFPGRPSTDDIETYGLVSDYVYAGGSGDIPQDYLMSYADWNISLGVSMGYRIRTRLGTIGVAGGAQSGIGLVTYDDSVYRPASQTIRDNLNVWRFVNRLSLSTSFDSRDYQISPSAGTYVSQSVLSVGGILGGSRHYIRTTTGAQAYFTLFNVPVGDTWYWKLVLAGNSNLGVIWPQFIVPGTRTYTQLEPNMVADPETDLLTPDGMSVARGWSAGTPGKMLWNNWLELRMPLVEQIVWVDSFLDAVRVYPERSFSGSLSDWMFGVGIGLRFTIPQFPIRLYLAKRFRVDDGIQWQSGNIFGDPSRPGTGFDFVISLSGLL